MLSKLLILTVVVALAIADGDVPSKGKCTAHSAATGPHANTIGYLVKNETQIVRDFPMPDCPWLANEENVCCSRVQYENLGFHLRIINMTFLGCPACNYAMRNLFCYFTCAPYQSEFNHIVDITPDGRVLEIQLNVSASFSKRLWQACENAIMGELSIKVTFPTGVYGLFSTIVEHSPMVEGKALLGKIKVDGNLAHRSWNNTPMNISLINDEFKCSRPGYVKQNDYPLPEAMVGSLHLQVFSAIIFGLLLLSVAGAGALNRGTSAASDENEELWDPSRHNGTTEGQKSAVSLLSNYGTEGKSV